MKKMFVALLFPVVLTGVVDNSWYTLSNDVQYIWKTCVEKKFQVSLWKCVQNRSLNIFDKLVTSDIIPLMDNLRLVRPLNNINSNNESQADVANHTINDDYYDTWSKHVIKKIADTFKTHVLQIDLLPQNTARRRHRNQMLPMMLFGVTALGMIIIPMGFQFLAVLGGKALLLAKMALLLSSINGIKRVAASGVPYLHYQNAWYDRNLDVGPR